MIEYNDQSSAWWIKDSYDENEIEQLVQWGLSHFWMQNHQMSDLVAPDGYRVMVRGKGCHIYDINGNRYIDGLAGLFLKNIGHHWPEVADAVKEQMLSLTYANSGAYSTVPGILLAKKISELTGHLLNKVFFCGGGAEAVEIAIKMARQYRYISGKKRATKIISRRGQYHGSTYATMSIGNRGNSSNGMFEPLMYGSFQVDPPYCYRCPWGFENRTRFDCCMLSVGALKNVIESEGPDTIAAFIATPIPNGSQIPHAQYWPDVKELCERYDIPIIADEVICGFGRLGTWFGMERFGITPDIMTIAKGLTSGELPGGGVVASQKIAEAFDNSSETEGFFSHGVTFGGHPVVMAAGLKNIEILEREGLVQNSAEIGNYLYEKALSILQENHPSVGFVGGGMGLLMNIELVQNRKSKERFPGGFNGGFAKRLTELMREKGLAVRTGDSIVLAPPLTFTKDLVDETVDIIDRSLFEIAKEYPTKSG